MENDTWSDAIDHNIILYFLQKPTHELYMNYEYIIRVMRDYKKYQICTNIGFEF